MYMNSPKDTGVSPEIIEKSINGDFEKMLDDTFADHGSMEGSVVKGIILEIEKDFITVDIGMKAEGRISAHEFIKPGEETPAVKVGDSVDVYVDNLDDMNGRARLSREKACREEVMTTLEKAHADSEPVKGIIFGRVKGGFTVDVSGVLAFLPGSQVDIRPIKDMSHLMNTLLDFMIIKIDRKRGNLIVSRRAVMDEHRSEARDELLETMEEGMEVEGVVKNITDYGAFIDLGGIDGLLHITDIAWHRINHPSEIISVGQVLKMKVIRFDEDTKRVSLGLKQLQDDPWTTVNESFPIGKKVKGTITNITEYGAFVELASGIEGLIHVSEMSWTRKNVHPGKIVSTSQEVEVVVLEIDPNKRRISLGLKQCQENPWQAYADAHPEGEVVEGAVRSITDFGIFIGLNEEIDGLIHMSDISWEKSGEEALRDYKKGDMIKAKVLSLDPEKERISLGIKQLESDPFAEAADKYKKGDTVKVTVTEISDNGLNVELAKDVAGYIKRTDLSIDKGECDTSKFKEGDTIEAQVVSVGKRDRRINLSVKAQQLSEEKEAVAEYATSSEGEGSALADALGAALKDKPAEKKATAKKAAPKKAAAKKEPAKKTETKKAEKADK
jgi:small subunit ribosomal protein S1